MPGFELIGDEERSAVNEVFDKGGVLFRLGFEGFRSDSYKVRDFEQAFAQKFCVRRAQAVTSGTAALKVGLKALGVGQGDEVVTQCFTFVATAEAILECGAIPVITEIDRTLNMDPDDLAAKITPKTKAIIPVHMLGAASQMNKILQVARDCNIPVLEDTAQACGGKYRGQPLGTLGAVGTFSFDFGKTLTTGEGGMVVTNDEQVYLRARAYSDHGHDNNPDFPRGEDTRATYGFNYRMMELQGAIGLVQLGKLEGALKRQKGNKAKIKEALRNVRSIQFREFSDEEGEIGDALVFFLETDAVASLVARKLFELGIRFKILPEALRWHFAGAWDHIFSSLSSYQGRDIRKMWRRSEEILKSTIAIPIFIKMDEQRIEWMGNKLLEVLKGV